MRVYKRRGGTAAGLGRKEGEGDRVTDSGQGHEL